MLKDFSSAQQEQILRIGVIENNPILLKALLKDKSIRSKFLAQPPSFIKLDLCRQGHYTTFSGLYNSTDPKQIVEPNTGNTCLHEAAKYGNLSMIRYFLNMNSRDQLCNLLNKNHQTSLMTTIKHNSVILMCGILVGNNYEQSAIALVPYTDMKIKDKDNKLVFQVEPKMMNESRARILEFLEKEYYDRL